MNVAIIPARGGSKRIPRKNVKLFCGKPMIAWSIEAAKSSNLFQKIIVSTEDEEIADVARSFGADVPFIRPLELADDYTTTRPVVNHAIREIEIRFGLPEYVCVIYATAPFVQVTDLLTCYANMVDQNACFGFSATSFPFPIQRAFKLSGSGIEMFQEEYRNARSQDLEEAYHDAGQFYWGQPKAFLENLPMFSEHSVPIILPRYRVHDIDTQEDWERAEVMFRALGFAQ